MKTGVNLINWEVSKGQRENFMGKNILWKIKEKLPRQSYFYGNIFANTQS